MSKKNKTLLLFLIANLLFSITYGQSINTDAKTAREVLASGNMRKAIKHYTELLRVHENNTEYNAYLGYAYLNSRIDRTKAVEHLEKAAKSRTADAFIYYDLGKAYMLCYRFDEAIESF